MMAALFQIVGREVALAYGLGGRGSARFWMPVAFFIAVAAIYPFAVGSDAQLLQRTGGGVIWVAALLASILPMDRLVGNDIEQGVIDQWAIRGISEEVIALAKTIGHWLSFGPPLMLAALLSSALLGLDARQVMLVEAGLAIATPALAALGLMIAALTAGIRHGPALGGLLLLPLAVPMLIFGAGSLYPGGENGLLLLAAGSIFLVAVGPIAAGAAIRAGRE